MTPPTDVSNQFRYSLVPLSDLLSDFVSELLSDLPSAFSSFFGSGFFSESAGAATGSSASSPGIVTRAAPAASMEACAALRRAALKLRFFFIRYSWVGGLIPERRANLRAVHRLMAPRTPTGATRKEPAVVEAANDQVPWAALLLEMALQAKRLITLGEQLVVHRTVHRVAARTPFPHRFVLEDKRPAL